MFDLIRLYLLCLCALGCSESPGSSQLEPGGSGGSGGNANKSPDKGETAGTTHSGGTGLGGANHTTGGASSDGGVSGGAGSNGPTGPLALEPGFNLDLFIDGDLNEDCMGEYDPAQRLCTGGSDTAYDSIAGALAVAAPGTRFLVRAGTYAEVIHLKVSGTPTGYIGVVAFESELVIIGGVDSVEDGENYGPIWLDHVDYNWVDGIQVSGSIGMLRSVDSHHNVVQNCDFKGANIYPSASKRGGLYFASSHYNRIVNNRITEGTDSLSLIASDHNLVAHNRFHLAGHDVWSIKCGSYNVVRDNEMTNPNQKLGSVMDCEAGTSSWHGNGDQATSSDKRNATKHNLIQDNVFHDAEAGYYSTSHGAGIQYAGQDGIIRRNVFYQTHVGIGMAHYTGHGEPGEAEYNTGNRIYNNVFHDNYCAAVALASSDGPGEVSDNEFRNNIVWDNRGYGDEDCNGTSPTQLLYRTPFSGYTFVRNLIGSSRGNEVIQEEFGEASTLSEFSATDLFIDIIGADPGFDDAASNVYTLSSTSPAVDEGAFLSAVTSESGSGKTLRVADASYFYDGYGILGEVGDQVQLEGQADTATVLAIDYASNSLELDRALTWKQGVGISLAYNGRQPDLGYAER